MKLPLAWLSKFVAVNESIERVAERFYLLGFGVESIQNNVIDLEITPNRGDCLSILGLAREYAAATGKKLEYSLNRPVKISHQKDILSVSDESRKVVNYRALIFKDVTIGPSPRWLADRLETVGIKNVNNIVDVTNLVMVEIGQPLHAFDLDKIFGKLLNFRLSQKNEALTLINGKKYLLPADSLVINDQNRVIDLVGIQGGNNSSIGTNTKNIVIQAVVPSSKTIRKTSKSISLSTPASYRFERGVDPLQVDSSLEMACHYIAKLTGRNPLSDVSLPNRSKQRRIKFNFELIEDILGVKIQKTTASRILSRLGFKINNSLITVPSWRDQDIKFPEDIVEEIARLHGYGKIVPRALLPIAKKETRGDRFYLKVRKIAEKLLAAGWSEVITYSFAPAEIIDTKLRSRLVEISNPISRENRYLRPSIIPLLVSAAEKNTYYPDINWFEIGNVFTSGGEKTKIAFISTAQSSTVKLDKYSGSIKTRRSYFVGEFGIEELLYFNLKFKANYVTKPYPFKTISKHPPAVRDLSIIVKTNHQIDEIRDFILKNEPVLICELFDEYRSKSLGKNNHSLAFHVVLDNPKKALESREIDLIIGKIAKNLQSKFGAVIR